MGFARFSGQGSSCGPYVQYNLDFVQWFLPWQREALGEVLPVCSGPGVLDCKIFAPREGFIELLVQFSEG